MNRIDLDGGRRLPLVEEFYTVQGEGFNAGEPVYFIRLGGCDMGCSWCDAKFTWSADRYPLVAVETIVSEIASSKARAVVVTGGEPLLYPMGPLTDELHRIGRRVYLETAGAHPLSGDFDWICLSPKRQRPPLDEVCAAAGELKTVISAADDFAWAEQCALRVGQGCRLYLQPEWDRRDAVIPEIVAYVKEHPQWCISLQLHKYMNIP